MELMDRMFSFLSLTKFRKHYSYKSIRENAYIWVILVDNTSRKMNFRE